MKNNIFENIDALKEAGFGGGLTVKNLKCDCSRLPDSGGIYLIVRETQSEPEFLKIGTGGFFKGKNPNVSEAELKENWVTDAIVVYIGKATSLRKRVSQYMRFGSGCNVGHYGGRLIWQLADSDSLRVFWKTTPGKDPGDVESELIQDFKAQYNGCRPFANLKD